MTDPEDIEITADELAVGDMVDLESCPFAKNDPIALFEYGVVMEAERTSDGMILIGYENVNGAYRYEPARKLIVRPRKVLA